MAQARCAPCTRASFGQRIANQLYGVMCSAAKPEQTSPAYLQDRLDQHQAALVVKYEVDSSPGQTARLCMLRVQRGPAADLVHAGRCFHKRLQSQAQLFSQSKPSRGSRSWTSRSKTSIWSKLGASKAPDSAAEVPAGPWLVVGLGNPGKKYAGTRHNVRMKHSTMLQPDRGINVTNACHHLQVGFAVLDLLASQEGIQFDKGKSKALVGTGFLAGQKVILAQPQGFMNLSGQSVGQLCAFHKVSCSP